MIVTQNGYAVKFNEKNVRSMGRTASGVKAINLKNDVILHVGSDEKGFVLEADLTVKDYNGNITHHYRGNMNVKIGNCETRGARS